jgi:hypothetical protein
MVGQQSWVILCGKTARVVMPDEQRVIPQGMRIHNILLVKVNLVYKDTSCMDLFFRLVAQVSCVPPDLQQISGRIPANVHIMRDEWRGVLEDYVSRGCGAGSSDGVAMDSTKEIHRVERAGMEYAVRVIAEGIGYPMPLAITKPRKRELIVGLVDHHDDAIALRRIAG